MFLLVRMLKKKMKVFRVTVSIIKAQILINNKHIMIFGKQRLTGHRFRMTKIFCIKCDLYINMRSDQREKIIPWKTKCYVGLQPNMVRWGQLSVSNLA